MSQLLNKKQQLKTMTNKLPTILYFANKYETCYIFQVGSIMTMDLYSDVLVLTCWVGLNGDEPGIALVPWKIPDDMLPPEK